MVGLSLLAIIYVIILPAYIFYNNVFVKVEWYFIVAVFAFAFCIGALSLKGKIPTLNFFARHFLLSFSKFYKEFLMQSAKYFCADNKTEPFKKVVEIEFSNSIKVIGFITNKYKDFSVVYIPTSPSPASGVLIHVNNEKIKEIDLSPEEMIEYGVTHGVKTIKFK